ncbi:hypothetical protein [Armatimonas sp.]|uniref:hypothetical protein n=1 Tax=Armatimonas sp. TaxID=1872638 RepID=UPI003751E3F0
MRFLIIFYFLFLNIQMSVCAEDKQSVILIDSNKSRLSRNQYEKTFENYLSEIAQKRKKCIICDPLIFDQGQNRILEKKEFKNQNVASDEFLSEFCSYYGYKYIISDSGNLLLLKDYNKYPHMPSVTYDEIMEGLRRMKKIKESITSVKSSSAIIDDLLHSLSSSDLLNFTKGIMLKDLPLNQQDLIWKFAFLSKYRGFSDVDYLYIRLRGCKKNTAVFTYKTYFGLELPIYSGPFSPLNMFQQWDVVLSRWIYTQPGGGTAFDGGKDAILKDGIVKTIYSDPTTPSDNTFNRNSLLCKNIGYFINNASKDQKRNYIISEAVKDKPVVLAGGDNSSFKSIMADISYVLDLKITNVNGFIHIDFFEKINYSDVSNFKENIFSCIPKSFLNAVNFREILQLKKPEEKNQKLKNSDRVYISSVKRLRELVDPGIKDEKFQKNTLISKDSEIYDLIALSSMSTFLSSLLTITTDIPKYISDRVQFLDSIVTLKMTDASDNSKYPNRFNIDFQLKSKNSGGFQTKTARYIRQ